MLRFRADSRGRARAGALAAALLLGLSGCALTPAYERPAAPVPARWSGASTPSLEAAQDAAALRADWRGFIREPALQALVERALAHNRDVRIAALTVEQVHAAYDVRRADRLPTLNLAATGQRQPATGPNPSSKISSVYTAGLAMASWELDVFGRVAALSDAALAQYLASAEARRAAQVSIVAAVASTWLALQSDDALLALARKTLASREDSLRLVQLRAAHGAASDLDLRSAQTLVEAARVNLAQQERARALDLHALALLVGQPVDDALPAAATARTPFAALPANLPSEVLLQRPDILAAEQQLIAANANIGAARAAFFPRITLTASAGSASSALAELFKSGSWGWTLAPQALLPIFDAGRNQANLAAAEAARDIAMAQYEKAIQTAFREVADALTSQSSLAEQLRAAEAQLQAQAELARLADLRVASGVASSLDQLDAQRALLAAQQQVEQTRLAWRQSQVALFKALGGGAGAAIQ